MRVDTVGVFMRTKMFFNFFKKKKKFQFLLFLVLSCFCLPLQAQVSSIVSSDDFASIPPAIGETADPFIMINLSVELTQQAEAYTDVQTGLGRAIRSLPGGTACGDARVNGTLSGSGVNGGWGICYTSREEYIGYFDPDKCYAYIKSDGSTYSSEDYEEDDEFYTASSDTANIQNYGSPYVEDTAVLNNIEGDYFTPVAMVDNPGANRTCSGDDQFSGNFMNWSTMTAIDEFRYVMTGGARIMDTVGSGAMTLLTRAHRYTAGGASWPFVNKLINDSTLPSRSTSRNGEIFINEPELSTPWDPWTLEVINTGYEGNQVHFRRQNGTIEGTFRVIVEACKNANGLALEDNCVEYTDGDNTWYKPEGKIQENALSMRFALMSYVADRTNNTDGAVLRANAKYIGLIKPDTIDGGFLENENAEFNSFGQMVYDPDDEAGSETGVNNSGVINYINNFALNRFYKSLDPVSEMFYQSLRYFMGIGPETNHGYDQAYNLAQYDNFPIIDNSHEDGWIDPIPPELGGACQENYTISVGDIFAHQDGSVPGVPAVLNDGKFVPAITSINGVSFADADSDPLNALVSTNTVGALEGIGNLGERFVPLRQDGLGVTGRRNGYWVAGMAYWANVNDVRPDVDGFQTIRTFAVDTQEYKPRSQVLLGSTNQFWLAGKYGGFEDRNRNGLIDNLDSGGTEADINNDGSPDGYTLASLPSDLRDGIDNAFSQIQANVGAGSAAAVVANTGSGEGAIYQALYSPEVVSATSGDAIEWVGLVHGIYIDELGQLREDDGPTSKNSLANDDSVIEIFFDEEDGETKFRRFGVNVDGEKDESNDLTPDNNSLTDEEFKPIWNASDVIGSIPEENIQTNRVYSSAAENGRYIFTAFDRADDNADFDGLILGNGGVDEIEVPFQVADGIDPSDYGYFGLGPTAVEADTQDIINFIRGYENIEGFRSRTVDGERFLLGDIVHSSPVVVGAPNDNYDLIYGDETYGNFVNHYARGDNKRRQMVYVGGNDGMLHAFNAGKVDLTNGIEFDPADHELGAEMWAYVPYNLLPHLRWLTEPSYPHVYYVDGEVQAFDVNIFDSADPDYPGGWGTIIVAGMRFGGGDINVDHDNDGDPSNDKTMHSAYIIIDVTNPDNPPKLIAEITDVQLGFTTSRPALVKRRARNQSDGTFESPSQNDWYLVFGSGPFGNSQTEQRIALESAVSFQEPHYFIFDLKSKTLQSSESGGFAQDFNVSFDPDGFVGGYIAADWDNDFTDDALYFGTVEGTVAAPEGKLMRASISFEGGLNITDNIFIDAELPISAAPTIFQDNDGREWIYAGTGRFFAEDDNSTEDLQNYYFGVKEPLDGEANPSFSDLIDTSGVAVFEDGTLRDLTQLVDSEDNFAPQTTNTFPDADGDSDEEETFAELVAQLKDDPGWKHQIPRLGERNTTESAIFRESILYTTYDVPGTKCDIGEGYLYAPSLLAGVPVPSGALGLFSNTTTVNGTSVQQVRQGVDLGPGLPSKPQVVGDKTITQSSTGELQVTPLNTSSTETGRQTWLEIPVTF